MKGTTDQTSSREVAKTVFRQFNGLDLLLIKACRKSIVEVYRKEYKKPDVRQKLISKIFHDISNDQANFFGKSIDALKARSEQLYQEKNPNDNEEIDQWLDTYANLDDEHASKAFFHADSIDLCNLGELLNVNVVYFSVTRNLSNPPLRDKDGYKIEDKREIKEKAVSAESGAPITAFDANGRVIPDKKVQEIIVRYKTEKKADYGTKTYVAGKEQDQSLSSDPRIILFNVAGAHSDLLLTNV